MCNRNLWQQTQDVALTEENLAALFDNKIPAIRIQNFATMTECQAFSMATHAANFTYSKKVDPPIGRIGIAQFGYIDKTKEEYFAAVERENRIQHEIMDKSFDPLARLIGMLRDVVSTEVNIAQDPNSGSFFAGLIRLIHVDAALHLDFTQIDAPQWGVTDVNAQLAWNLFLTVPASGGECIVYKRLWQPEDEAHKAAGSDIYYAPELVQECQTKEIKPVLGDVVLFNSRNFHEVKVSYGERMTFTSFIGRKPNGNIVIWS